MSLYEEAPLPVAGEQPLAPSLPRLRGVPSRPRHVSLRVVLLALLLGLLVATVVSISMLQWSTSTRSIQELESKTFRMLVLALSSQVQSFLEPSALVLQEAQTRAEYGRLAVHDADALATYLVDRLRYQPNLSWLSYTDAPTGRSIGAWRDPAGQIVLRTASPERDDGRPTEVVVQPDGSRAPYSGESPAGFDPRESGWFVRASGNDGVSWTEPFQLAEGRRGVTAALALRAADTGALRGVFSADVYLDDLSRYLVGVLQGHEGKALLLSRRGEIVARSYTPDTAPGPGLLAAGLAAMPVPLAEMPADQPLGFTFEFDGARYIVAGQMLRIPGGPEWATAYWAPEAQFAAATYREQQVSAAIGLLFLVVAVALAILLANRIAGPLHAIAQDLEQVARFNLLHAPRGASFVEEVAVVRDSTERVKASLRSFGHYVPTDVVRDLLARGEEARLGGQTRCLTVHFSDVVNFTNLSEHLPPAEIVEHLAEYLQVMTRALEEHGGTIDKFMGDGILAFFNAPSDLPNHPALACRAALQAQEWLAAAQGRWRTDGRPAFQARIGLHMGDVLVGNIGTAERFAYTVIGDPVNLASRLEVLNKVYGTRILASQEVREAAGADFEWRRLDRVAVAGRTGSTVVNELLGLRGRVAAEVLAARDQYEAALDAYYARRFDYAEAGFRAAATLHASRAAEMMYLRAEAFSGYPPPPDWDGVYMLRSKD
jgi:adenylate cyclase